MFADFPFGLPRSQQQVTGENMAAYTWLVAFQHHMQAQYQHQHQNRVVLPRSAHRHEMPTLSSRAFAASVPAAGAEPQQPVKKPSIWSPGLDVEKMAGNQSPAPEGLSEELKPSLMPPVSPVDTGKSNISRKLTSAADHSMQPWSQLVSAYRFALC
jgi:hypothetical protein